MEPITGVWWEEARWEVQSRRQSWGLVFWISFRLDPAPVYLGWEKEMKVVSMIGTRPDAGSDLERKQFVEVFLEREAVGGGVGVCACPGPGEESHPPDGGFSSLSCTTLSKARWRVNGLVQLLHGDSETAGSHTPAGFHPPSSQLGLGPGRQPLDRADFPIAQAPPVVAPCQTTDGAGHQGHCHLSSGWQRTVVANDLLGTSTSLRTKSAWPLKSVGTISSLANCRK